MISPKYWSISCTQFCLWSAGAVRIPNALKWDSEKQSGWQTSELYYAMKQAVDNRVFSLRDYMDRNIDSPETYRLIKRSISTC